MRTSTSTAIDFHPVRQVRSVAIAGKLNCAVLAQHFEPSALARGLLPGSDESPKISHLVPPLVEMGYHLHLVTLSREAAESYTVRGEQVTLTVCPMRRAGRARDAFSFEREQIRRAVLTVPVDVVHAHHTYEYALSALATGLPVLVSVRDWAPYIARTQLDPFRLVKVAMQFRTLVQGSHFTVNSPYLQKRIRRVVRRGVPIVPNCLPDQWLRTGAKALRRESPVIVAVNRGFGRRKNVKVLLRAYSQLRRQRLDASLVLVGPEYGPGGPAEAWAKSEGLAGGVEFVGPLTNEETFALMDRADLLAHPSLEETFGIVLMEAMARGTPVVGGRRSGAVPWVLGEGEAGVLTDVRDPQALADAMLKVLGDPEAWSRLSAAGLEHVRRRFSAAAVAGQYAECYEQVWNAKER